MPQLHIDRQQVDVEDGATVLDAARKLGIEIPTLCYRSGAEPQTSCLVCLVRVNGAEQLAPACATVVTDGMEVESETEGVRAARRTALELLLGDHLGDCIGPCQNICPARMNIPGMIEHIAGGQWEQALAIVMQSFPIPAILGHICAAPCEKGCRRGHLDTAISIQSLHRFLGEAALGGDIAQRCEVGDETGHRVAVVGGGPAGLTAAYYLAQLGHECVIFDDHDRLGGSLRYAIPPNELPRDVLDGEVSNILNLGIGRELNTVVGRDVTVDDVCADFDAVVMAAGELSEEDALRLGLTPAERGVRADRETGMTDCEGVFVAGAALSPSRHAVRAVASGRNAAASIDQYLSGEAVTGTSAPYTVTMRRLDDDELAQFAAGAPRYDRIEPANRERGLTTQEAQAEADRCLHCECAALDDCLLRKWAEQYGASTTRYRDNRRRFRRVTTHPNLTYEPGKCIQCGLCVQIASREEDKLGLTYVGRGFDVRIGVPFDEPLSAALDQLAQECADACPTGALISRENEDAGGDQQQARVPRTTATEESDV